MLQPPRYLPDHVTMYPYQPPSHAFSPATSTNHTWQVHAPNQLCHHFHLCLRSTLAYSVLVHHPSHLSLPFNTLSFLNYVSGSGPHKDIFTSSHPHPLYQPSSVVHLPPSLLSHPSHQPMLYSPPPPLPPLHPPSSLLLTTTPHRQPLIVRHHHGCFILRTPSGLPICCLDYLQTVWCQCSHFLQTSYKRFGASFRYSHYVPHPSLDIYSHYCVFHQYV